MVQAQRVQESIIVPIHSKQQTGAAPPQSEQLGGANVAPQYDEQKGAGPPQSEPQKRNVPPQSEQPGGTVLPRKQQPNGVQSQPQTQRPTFVLEDALLEKCAAQMQENKRLKVQLESAQHHEAQSQSSVDLKRKREQLQSQIATLESKVAALESKRDGLQDRVEYCETVTDAKERKLQDLTSKVERVETALAHLRTLNGTKNLMLSILNEV